VVLNVGRGKILVGMEDEDITKQFWWKMQNEKALVHNQTDW